MENIDYNILLERIEKLAAQMQKNMTTVFIESGAGKNFKSNLKTAKPSLGKITLIANYLNTTVDYLIGNTDTPSPVSTTTAADTEENTDVKEFARLAASLPEDDQKRLLEYVLFLKSRHTHEP